MKERLKGQGLDVINLSPDAKLALPERGHRSLVCVIRGPASNLNNARMKPHRQKRYR